MVCSRAELSCIPSLSEYCPSVTESTMAHSFHDEYT